MKTKGEQNQAIATLGNGGWAKADNRGERG